MKDFLPVYPALIPILVYTITFFTIHAPVQLKIFEIHVRSLELNKCPLLMAFVSWRSFCHKRAEERKSIHWYLPISFGRSVLLTLARTRGFPWLPCISYDSSLWVLRNQMANMEEDSDFVETLKSLAQCPVCLEIPRSGKFYLCTNSHSICENCYEDLRRSEGISLIFL